MRTKLDFPTWSGALVAAVTLLGSTQLPAQTRITLPAGSVILVSTEQPIESATMKVGQTFETSVVGGVSVNGYALIPANSRVRGTVAYVQPATRERSGVMQVAFDRLTLPDGSSYQIAGRLTSTDSTERRQIEQRADPRVVLVGERGGLGAAIAGAGSSSSPAAGILAALGNMLSEGRNVTVPAGTQLAVQLERSLTLTGRGGLNAADESTIYTATERIRAAQQALARRAYFAALRTAFWTTRRGGRFSSSSSTTTSRRPAIWTVALRAHSVFWGRQPIRGPAPAPCPPGKPP